MSPCFAVFVSSELFLFAHDMCSEYLIDTAVTYDDLTFLLVLLLAYEQFGDGKYNYFVYIVESLNWCKAVCAFLCHFAWIIAKKTSS